MKTWTRMPVFRLLIPFSAGILIGLKHSELNRDTILAFGLIAGLSILFTIRRYGTGKYALRWLAGIPWTGTWLLAGVIAGNIQTATELKAPADNCQGVIVTVDAPLSWSESSVRFPAEMRMIHNDGSWIPWKETVMVSVINGQKITTAPGDLLLLSAVPEKVKQADLTAMFDYREYLRSMGIRYQVRCSIDNVQVLQKSYKAPLKHFAYPVRQASSNILHKALPDSAVLGITAALVLGDERWLQKQVEEGYAGAGVLHVLCVSGMHVVLMLSIFERLLSLIRLPTRVSRYKYPFLILLTWYYTSLTGFTPSIVRAAMMMTLVLGAKILNRPNQIPNMLAACMLLLISLNPSYLVNAGFQLSFLAVTGIVFIHSRLKWLFEPEKKIMRLIWELISVSIAAQLATFPLSMYYFHQFPNYFLLANLLIVPLSTLVLYEGMILIIAGWIPAAGTFIVFLLTWSVKLLNGITIGIASLPDAVTNGIYINLPEFILITSLVFSLFLLPGKLGYLKIKVASFLTIAILGSFICRTALSSNYVKLTVHRTSKGGILSVIKGRNATLLYLENTSISEKNKAREYLRSEGMTHLSEKEIPEKTGVSWLEDQDKIIYSNLADASQIYHLGKTMKPDLLITSRYISQDRLKEIQRKCEPLKMKIHPVTVSGSRGKVFSR